MIAGYSIVIAPANKILEHWLFKGSFGPEQKNQRHWAKNLSRFLIALMTVVLAIFLADKITQFLGLLGALLCAPLALTLPALLHFKAIAKSRSEKIFDVFLILISIAILVFSTTQSIINW